MTNQVNFSQKQDSSTNSSVINQAEANLIKHAESLGYDLTWFSIPNYDSKSMLSEMLIKGIKNMKENSENLYMYTLDKISYTYVYDHGTKTITGTTNTLDLAMTIKQRKLFIEIDKSQSDKLFIKIPDEVLNVLEQNISSNGPLKQSRINGLLDKHDLFQILNRAIRIRVATEFLESERGSKKNEEKLVKKSQTIVRSLVFFVGLLLIICIVVALLMSFGFIGKWS